MIGQRLGGRNDGESQEESPAVQRRSRDHRIHSPEDDERILSLHVHGDFQFGLLLYSLLPAPPLESTQHVPRGVRLVRRVRHWNGGGALRSQTIHLQIEHTVQGEPVLDDAGLQHHRRGLFDYDLGAGQPAGHRF